jgi:hypothetical protein
VGDAGRRDLARYKKSSATNALRSVWEDQLAGGLWPQCRPQGVQFGRDFRASIESRGGFLVL